MPDTLQERQRLADELVELAQHLDDPWLSFWAAIRDAWIVGLEAGDRSQVESGLATMRTLAASVPEPIVRLAAAALRVRAGRSYKVTFRHLSNGRSRRSRQARHPASPTPSLIFGGQLFNVRYHQGRTGELVEQAVRLAGEPDSLRRGARSRRSP